MTFSGRVFFSFGDPAVWHFYRFARELAGAGESVQLEWTPVIDRGEGVAVAAFVGLRSPEERGRFLHAMLGLVHLEGRDATALATVEAAIEAAAVTPGPVSEAELESVGADASALGVVRVPSLYRHGPVVELHLNGAALEGDVMARARTIDAMVADDGIWELRKP